MCSMNFDNTSGILMKKQLPQTISRPCPREIFALTWEIELNLHKIFERKNSTHTLFANKKKEQISG